ncbi:hypothetical protein H8S95_18170 [Pontibacter sp. KCTC 32443]|uniref:hypothetical protein n=1 Tax=Pontibacter TaxID=323449 RepID=UPI00164DAF96|nr:MULTISPECIES: hypothetical protein [Pontibacter]MBC5776008.1 hypothetical protein [Pontibacter sp. KCTC 32443]
MENRQNSSQSNQSFSNQSSQSNQPSASQSSQSSRSQSSQPSASSTTGSSVGSQSSRSGSSSSSSSKMGGLDMNAMTSKLQELGTQAMNKVNGLSTTQKVVGGSLLALGAGWLAMNSRNKTKTRSNLNTTRTNKFGRSSS